jgi:hypothetical protein
MKLILDRNANTASTIRALRAAKPVAYNRALFNPKTGDIIGVNVGSSVRPEIIPVDPSTGIESVEMFLARGGSVVKCDPCTRGQKNSTVRVKGSRSMCGDRGRNRFSIR